jgi:RNA polymerase sigma-70 factor (ECF subfamily)
MEVHTTAMRNATEEPVASAGMRAVPDALDATHAAAAAILPRQDVPPALSSRIPLVEQARSGDRIAFERLIEPWIEPAFRIALAILGREADARDATQDALLDAWRNIRSLRDPDRFDAWLGRIHVNACRAVGRRRGRSAVREIPLSMLPDPDEPAGRGRGLEEESASLDELEHVFARLSLEQRTILVLHHLERQPVARIAAVFGIPEGTAKWRLHAARAALERALEEERR